MIRRSSILASLNNALARSRVVVLAGPRQCGKTTLARELIEEDSLKPVHSTIDQMEQIPALQNVCQSQKIIQFYCSAW